MVVDPILSVDATAPLQAIGDVPSNLSENSALYLVWLEKEMQGMGEGTGLNHQISHKNRGKFKLMKVCMIY